MTERDIAMVQGMLDARHDMRLPLDQSVLCPYSEDEPALREAWYTGYNMHLDPKVSE